MQKHFSVFWICGRRCCPAEVLEVQRGKTLYLNLLQSSSPQKCNFTRRLLPSLRAVRTDKITLCSTIRLSLVPGWTGTQRCMLLGPPTTSRSTTTATTQWIQTEVRLTTSLPQKARQLERHTTFATSSELSSRLLCRVRSQRLLLPTSKVQPALLPASSAQSMLTRCVLQLVLPVLPSLLMLLEPSPSTSLPCQEQVCMVSLDSCLS